MAGKALNTLWDDEIGRHALLSRGWGSQDKRSIIGLTTNLTCAIANCPVEVRLLLLQLNWFKELVSYHAYGLFSFYIMMFYILININMNLS